MHPYHSMREKINVPLAHPRTACTAKAALKMPSYNIREPTNEKPRKGKSTDGLGFSLATRTYSRVLGAN